MKLQFLIRFVSERARYVRDLDLPTGTAFKPVKNQLHRWQTMSATQSLLDQDVDELVPDGSAVRGNLRDLVAKCGEQSLVYPLVTVPTMSNVERSTLGQPQPNVALLKFHGSIDNDLVLQLFL